MNIKSCQMAVALQSELNLLARITNDIAAEKKSTVAVALGDTRVNLAVPTSAILDILSTQRQEIHKRLAALGVTL